MQLKKLQGLTTLPQYIIGVILVFALVGCGQPKKPGAGGHGAMAAFPVTVVAEPVKQEKIENKIYLVGDIAADEVVEVKNEVAGVVKEIGFNEGEIVHKGQMLLMIDADKLNASMAQAEANLQLAKTTFDRLSSLIKAGAISQQELDQAKSDLDAKTAEADLIKAELKKTVIAAAFDGISGERKVSIGQYVDQGTILTYLIKQDPIKAVFHVPEKYVGQLKIDQEINLSVVAYPDEIFTGRVYFIDPQIDEQTRSALVKAVIPNPEGKLRRGMFGNMELTVNTRSNALTVPEIALIPKAEEVYVFVIDQDSKAQMKSVKVGIRTNGKAEIVEGLNPGDNVIVEGYQKIGPGSLVKNKELEAPAAKDPAQGH